MIVLCPVCRSNNIIYFRKYGDIDFLTCKTLKKCNVCELIFANPLPSNEDLNSYYSSGLYYDKVGDPFNHEILEFSYKLSKTRLELINKKIDNDWNKNVLDIGAGSAQIGKILLDKFPDSMYDAVEPDKAITNQWGSWVENHFDSIDKVNNTYNLIILNQVLEHINNPIEFLESLYRLIKNNGYLYIDVPYKDYLFKPSIEPHLLFWNKKSISFALSKTGFQLAFCDTAGMLHKQAKIFFNHLSLLEKIKNPWSYANKINCMMSIFRLPQIFDTFRRFQADQYGGDRQWLRCIAQKVD